MIGADTNVLLRLLVEDDDEQAIRQHGLVVRLLADTESAGDRLFITDVALCEVVWAMRFTYRVPREVLRERLEALVKTKIFAFEAPDGVGSAVAAFAAGRGDFADYLIRERARANGCEIVATFDKALLREDGFVAL